MKSILMYKDYRQFLSDFYNFKKETSTFSFRMFSELLELKSPNYMKLIISGKRNLTVSLIHKICKKFRFTSPEAEYFEALVLRDQSTGANERSYYQKRLTKFKKIKNKTMRPQVEYPYLHWYFPLILVAADGADEETYIADLNRSTGLKKDQIKTTVKFLIEKKVVYMENGKIHLSGDYLIYDDKASMIDAQRQFQMEQLGVANWVLKNEYSKNTKFLSHTFTIGKNSYAKYADKISDFLSELAEESNTELADDVVQLNLQYFPIKTLAKRMK